MIDQQNIFEALRTVVKDELRPIDEKFTQRFDEVLKSNDKLAHKLSHIETEIAAFYGGQRRQDESLNIHENRLKRIESVVGF